MTYVLTRIRARVAIVFDDCFPPGGYSSRGSYCFSNMLVSDINDYGTENIVHPYKNMSTKCTKFAFLLKLIKDNNPPISMLITLWLG